MAIRDKDETQEGPELTGLRKLQTLFLIGLFTFIAGIIVLITATVINMNNPLDFGAVIFIGPIPIVIGVGQDPIWIALFALIVGVLSIALLFSFRRRLSSREEAETNPQNYV